MKTIEYIPTTEMVINEAGNLQEFYRLANVLGKTRHIHLTLKEDDADILQWHYKYRGSTFSLQYNIYGGVTLSYKEKDKKTADKLLVRLKAV